MKRVFALMAAVLLAVAFVACGGGQEADSTTPVEESATTDTGDMGTDYGTTEETPADTGMEEGTDTGMDEGMGEGMEEGAEEGAEEGGEEM